ncbi:hypothetical protein FRC17_001279 [Serendipita sp. 399]|nr:hypothetical protein FRC17_001279 [Serendipita sp. 399]
MSITGTKVQLNTGASMPVLFLGTWKSEPGKVEHAVEYALRTAGYRGIDTATDYENEKEVGQGIAASGVPREDIFLTTKLKNPDHGRVEQALQYSLSALNTSYLDLCPDRSIDWLDTWKEMERVFKANPDKIKAIGVSNFSVPYLERLLAVSTVIPAVNQIELHPACRQQEIRDFCSQKGIVISAYSPLGSDESPLLTHPIVTEIAEKYAVPPATVLISLQANIPNTTGFPDRIKAAEAEAKCE